MQRYQDLPTEVTSSTLHQCVTSFTNDILAGAAEDVLKLGGRKTPRGRHPSIASDRRQAR